MLNGIMDYSIIDSKIDDINGDDIDDKITLLGQYFSNNSMYVENTYLSVKNGSTMKESRVKLNISGYYLKLFIGDFIGNVKNQILIKGESGGTGSYAIGVIYEFINGEFKEIFNLDEFTKRVDNSAYYIENYKLRVVCNASEKLFNIDISDNAKIYLDMIYDMNGNVKSDQNPTVSYPNTIYPIELEGDNYYSLLIQQRVIGVSNAHLLGAIQNTVKLYNGEFNVLNQQYLIIGEKMYIAKAHEIKNTKGNSNIGNKNNDAEWKAISRGAYACESDEDIEFIPFNI